LKLREEIRGLENTYRSAKAEWDITVEDATRIFRESSETKSENQKLMQINADLKIQLELFSKKLYIAENDRNRLSNELIRTQNDLDERIKFLQNELASARQRSLDLEKELNKKEIELTDNRRNFSERIDQLTKEAELLRREAFNATSKLAESQSQITESTNLMQQCKELKERITILDTERAELLTQMKQQAGYLQAAQLELRNVEQCMRKEMALETSERFKLENGSKQLQTRLDEFHVNLRRKESEWREEKEKLMNSHKQENSKLENEISKLEDVIAELRSAQERQNASRQIEPNTKLDQKYLLEVLTKCQNFRNYHSSILVARYAFQLWRARLQLNVCRRKISQFHSITQNCEDKEVQVEFHEPKESKEKEETIRLQLEQERKTLEEEIRKKFLLELNDRIKHLESVTLTPPLAGTDKQTSQEISSQTDSSQKTVLHASSIETQSIPPVTHGTVNPSLQPLVDRLRKAKLSHNATNLDSNLNLSTSHYTIHHHVHEHVHGIQQNKAKH
jgi:hypothetical protein